MTLKEWRLSKGWSQAKLAVELKGFLDGKWRQSHVASWENGIEPRRNVRAAIAQLTNGEVRTDSFTQCETPSPRPKIRK